MKFKLIIIMLVLAGVGVGQTTNGVTKQIVEYGNVKNSPEFAADLSKIAELKIFLPKQKFHAQELMLIDVAMLVKGDDELFLPNNLQGANILIKDSDGNSVFIESIFQVDAPKKFGKAKNTIIKGSTFLIVGCENQVVRDLTESLGSLIDSDDPTELFEKSLFRTLPDACIDVRGSADLEIWAEFQNRVVIVPKDGSKVKTPVGKIVIDKIKIRIEK